MKATVLTLLVCISSTRALSCYVCSSQDTPACHDLKDGQVKVEECKGSLTSQQSFACLKNTSFRNNQIETERSCIIVDGDQHVCRERKDPNLFGDCVACQFDGCNGEDVENNKSKVNRSNVPLTFITAAVIVFCSFVPVSL